MKIANISLSYTKSTAPKTIKLKIEKSTFNACPVRNDCTRLWSPMRCMRSPISLVSKNAMGSFSNFAKKSLTSEMFIFMDTLNRILLRINPAAARPSTIINSPNRMSHTSPMSLFLIPLSTMLSLQPPSRVWFRARLSARLALKQATPPRTTKSTSRCSR